MSEELPVRGRGGIWPRPVHHAGHADGQRYRARKEDHGVVDGVRLQDRRQKLSFRHRREISLHLNM